MERVYRIVSEDYSDYESARNSHGIYDSLNLAMEEGKKLREQEKNGCTWEIEEYELNTNNEPKCHKIPFDVLTERVKIHNYLNTVQQVIVLDENLSDTGKTVFIDNANNQEDIIYQCAKSNVLEKCKTYCIVQLCYDSISQRRIHNRADFNIIASEINMDNFGMLYWPRWAWARFNTLFIMDKDTAIKAGIKLDRYFFFIVK